MCLQADESVGMGLVEFLVAIVFDQMAVDPRLNARPLGDDAQLVPALGYGVLMPLLDLLLRGEPVCAESLAIQQTGRRQPRVVPANFHLWSIDPPGKGLERAARTIYRSDFG